MLIFPPERFLLCVIPDPEPQAPGVGMPFHSPTGLRLTAPNSSSPGHAPTIVHSAPGAEGMLNMASGRSRQQACSVYGERHSPGAREAAAAPQLEITRAGREASLLMDGKLKKKSMAHLMHREPLGLLSAFLLENEKGNCDWAMCLPCIGAYSTWRCGSRSVVTADSC